MKHLITMEELDRLDDYVLYDVRFDLFDSLAGRMAYEEGHLPGAYYLDLERDLSGEVTQDTGNHPLPELKDLEKKLSQTGLTNDGLAVVYDDGSFGTAARAWFVFRYFGHLRVKILEGGLPQALAYGVELTQKTPEAKPTDLELNENPAMTASYEEMKEHSQNPKDKVLIDSRSKARFEGKEEPLYDKAGHIPGAVNYFMGDVLNGKGGLKDVAELKEHFKDLPADKEIVVSCGSGVTACVNALALAEMDRDHRVYVGSYSQWLKKGNDVDQ